MGLGLLCGPTPPITQHATHVRAHVSSHVSGPAPGEHRLGLTYVSAGLTFSTHVFVRMPVTHVRSIGLRVPLTFPPRSRSKTDSLRPRPSPPAGGLDPAGSERDRPDRAPGRPARAFGRHGTQPPAIHAQTACPDVAVRAAPGLAMAVRTEGGSSPEPAAGDSPVRNERLPRLGAVRRIAEPVAHLALADRIADDVRTSPGVAAVEPTRTRQPARAAELVPWDDPAYWEPLSDAAIELAARAFRRRLAAERAGPSPLRRSPAGPSSRPA